MNVNSRRQPSSAVEAIFASAIAKVKAEAQGLIANIKAEFEEKIAGVRTCAEEALAKVKSEAEAKEKAHAEQVAKIRAEADAAIAIAKTEAAKMTAKVKVENLLSRDRQDKANVNSHQQSSTAVEKLFAGAMARVKVEAEEQIAKAKAQAEEKARVYTGTTGPVEAEAEKSIANIKAEFEEKIAGVRTYAEETIATLRSEVEEKEKSYSEMIAMLKAEVQEKAGAYTDTTAPVKTEAEEVIAKVRAQTEAIAKVKAEAKKTIAKVKDEVEGKVNVYADMIARVKAEVEEKARVYADTIAKVKAEEKRAITNESKDQPISETIQRMAKSLAVVTGEQSLTTLALSAKDIMQKEVVWGNPDDSVQQTFAKMQQYDTGYMMVGQDGVLQGIVSKSDLTGAISPYLRPIFAKWRRPLDDATLQIRIKWIMSRPVRTIKPETSLATIVENMRQLGVLCLPVVDRQGKVQGLVAEVNIFKALLKLKSSPNISTSSEVYQGQPAFSHPPHSRRTEPARTRESSLL